MGSVGEAQGLPAHRTREGGRAPSRTSYGTTVVPSTSMTVSGRPSTATVNMENALAATKRRRISWLRFAAMPSEREKAPFTTMASGMGSLPPEAGVR